MSKALLRKVKQTRKRTDVFGNTVSVKYTQKFTKITVNGIELFFALDGSYTGCGTADPKLMRRWNRKLKAA